MQTERKGAGTGRGIISPFRPRRALAGLAYVVLAVVTVPVFGQATAFDYAPGRVTIHAGVISVAPGTNPHLAIGAGVMEGLRRASFKPRRWDIVSPRGTGGAGGYVAEWEAAHWEIVLAQGQQTDLSGYHLLYICADDLTVLDDFQVDSLLEAVNEGAVLWIDSTDAVSTATGVAGAGTAWELSPFFFEAATDTLIPGGLPAPSHALLNHPFALSPGQLTHLGVVGGWDSLDVTDNIRNMQPLLTDGAGADLAAAGRFGSGGIVVTGGAIGADIAGWTAAANYDPPVAAAPDVMFGYNVMAWATGWTQGRQSPRSAGTSIGEVWADLDVKWQSLEMGPVAGAPVVDDIGRMFIATYGLDAGGQPMLYCFDADPARDIDRDGAADDGTIDYAGVDSADLIWSVDLGNYTPRSTSPAAATMVDPAGALQDVVLISVSEDTNDAGEVQCYSAATGALVWTYTVAPYEAGSDVVSISTPVVHNAAVYILASETTGATIDDAYGRVHCIDLDSGGDATDGFEWTYPDPANMPGAVTTDAAIQHMHALGPFDDPEWLTDAPIAELPRVPTPTPTIGNAPRFRDTEPGNAASLDPHLDAVIYCGTPVSQVWDLANAAIRMAPWGTDFALLPTPTLGGSYAGRDPFARNRQYFRVMLDAGAATVTGTTYYLETATGEESAAYAGTAPTDVAPYAEYPPADVAEFLADIPASSAGTRYGDIQAGCRVLLEHSGNDEMEFLPGPVVFKRPHEADPSDATAITDAERLQSGQRRAGAGVLTGDVLAVAVTRAMHPDSRTPVNLSGPGRMGAIAGLDPATGETKWRYSPWYALAQPLDAAGNFMATDMRHYVDAAPADAGDAIIGAASLEDPATPEEGAVGSIFALDPRPDATIRVRVEPAADPAAVVLSQAPLTGTSVASVGLSPVVQIVDAHNGGDWDTTPLGVPVLDPSCYTVDYENLRITIPAERAHDVRDIDGNRLGPAWGKMVILTYAYDDQGTPEDLTDDAFVEGEVGVVPDIARWEYVPGRIRLRNHPFVWAGGAIGVSARLPNGMPVQGFSVGGGTVVVNGLTWAGHGWLDVDAATFGQAPVPLPMGADVEISYQGMTVDGAIEVPNANDDWERHQVPYVIGRTIAPIAVANGGRTILVGTESYNPDQSVDRSPDASPYVGGFDRAGLVTDATRTLLTLTWDRVTNYVHGELVRPANRAPGALGVPIMSNAAAVRGDTALVGSRTIIEVPDTSGTPPEGYGGDPTIVAVGHAAGLSPSRTVITDNQRIIETVGTRLDWVCSGTRVLDVAWQNVAAEARAGFPGTVPVMRRPFSRPAKAIRLTRPDFLAPYTDAAGTLIAYNEAIYPPESGGSVPAGVPAGTPWPPAESGIGPGTYLVVDTGNNRVVEVDRAGRQVWPLDNIGDGTGGLAGSRRAGDHLGFDFYSSPYNTTLVLNAPSDAHRYMEWDTATDTWLMHTVIADSGNYRVVDVITTFDYDYTTGAVLQYHAIEVVTPGYVHAVYGPRAGEYIRVAYTKAVPITDPNNGDVVGYLCAGSNLHELLVVEHGTEQINPAAGAAMPSGTGLTWSMWSWLYDHDDDADADTDERLIFQNIRHVSADYCTDENGATYIYLMVVCGRYRGPLADPYMLTDTLGNEAGACCVEFRVDPATASHVPSTLGWAVPYWAYTDRDYEAGPLGHLWTPPGEGNAGAARAVKTFLPVCAQRIPGGRHIIATYASAVDNLTHVNLDTATDAIFGTPPSLGSEIFDVETTYGTANDPSTQMHTIDVNRCIPNPWGDAWTDPVNQPSFVQRSQDSPAPLRP